jgi:hypothetical protein
MREDCGDAISQQVDVAFRHHPAQTDRRFRLPVSAGGRHELYILTFMRLGLILIVAGSLVGCSVHRSVSPVVNGDAQPAAYEESASAALVFDPAIIAGEPPVELPRDERAASAFVGFEGPTTSFYWIHTDDLQDSDWGGTSGGTGIDDRYRRRAIIDKTGVLYR